MFYSRPTVHQPLEADSISPEGSLEVQEYSFVDDPDEDFFCPVTYDVLLQPHLTMCCGKHLSQKAATRIRKEGVACPMCATPQCSTVLNKHFRRQVNNLRVFCFHKDRGCRWQGVLSSIEDHVHSCPMKNNLDSYA